MTAPPLTLEFVLPFLPTDTLLRVAVCSWGSLGYVQDLGDWRERAVLDFGAALQADCNSWTAYMDLARRSLATRRAQLVETTAQRELFGVRLSHYLLQVALRVWGEQVLVLSNCVAAAVAASVPLAIVAASISTWTASRVGMLAFDRLSPEAQRRARGTARAGVDTGAAIACRPCVGLWPTPVAVLQMTARGLAEKPTRLGLRNGLLLAIVAAWLALGSVAVLSIAALGGGYGAGALGIQGPPPPSRTWEGARIAAQMNVSSSGRLMEYAAGEGVRGDAGSGAIPTSLDRVWDAVAACRQSAAAQWLWARLLACRGGTRTAQAPWAAQIEKAAAEEATSASSSTAWLYLTAALAWPLNPTYLRQVIAGGWSNKVAPLAQWLLSKIGNASGDSSDRLLLVLQQGYFPWEASALLAHAFVERLEAAYAGAVAAAGCPYLWPALAWLILMPAAAFCLQEPRTTASLTPWLLNRRTTALVCGDACYSALMVALFLVVMSRAHGYLSVASVSNVGVVVIAFSQVPRVWLHAFELPSPGLWEAVMVVTSAILAADAVTPCTGSPGNLKGGPGGGDQCSSLSGMLPLFILMASTTLVEPLSRFWSTIGPLWSAAAAAGVFKASRVSLTGQQFLRSLGPAWLSQRSLGVIHVLTGGNDAANPVRAGGRGREEPPGRLGQQLRRRR